MHMEHTFPLKVLSKDHLVPSRESQSRTCFSLLLTSESQRLLYTASPQTLWIRVSPLNVWTVKKCRRFPPHVPINGLSYIHETQENRWSAFRKAWVRVEIYISCFSGNSELTRIHNYLMVYLKVIFMTWLFYCTSTNQNDLENDLLQAMTVELFEC